MMVRRLVIGSFVSSLVAALLLTGGCQVGIADAGHDCPDGLLFECCRCVWPEDCIKKKTGREVPAWCDETPGGTKLDECRLSVQRFYGLPWWCAEFLEEPDAGDAGDGSTSACANGTCAALPNGWEPVLLASNALFVVPDCPASAPNVVFEGSSTPVQDPTCPTCSCDPPVGACTPPTSWTVGSSACLGDDVKTNFDPPSGWDGSCSSNTAISAGLQCGGKPCVASITISSPIIEEEPCVAHSDVPPIDVPRLTAGSYVIEGRACAGDPWPACSGNNGVCVPPANDPFAVCVKHDGDVLCPNGWDSKQVLYGSVDDQRSCSDCSCLPSTGATCSMKVQVFGDASCAQTELEVNISLDMGSDCHLLMSAVALAGKSADVLEYKPGVCEPSGGELLGQVVVTDATTFCCRTATG